MRPDLGIREVFSATGSQRCAVHAVDGGDLSIRRADRPPLLSLLTTTMAYCSAARLSKGSMLPRKSSLTSASIVSASEAFRRPSGRRATPYSNSAAVMAVMATSAAGSESSQVTTFGSGSIRASSDRTFVSRMITRRTPPRAAAHRAPENRGLRHLERRIARGYDSRGRRQGQGMPGNRRGWPAPRPPSIVRAVRHGHGAGCASPHQGRESSTSPSPHPSQALLTMQSPHRQGRSTALTDRHHLPLCSKARACPGRHMRWASRRCRMEWICTWWLVSSIR